MSNGGFDLGFDGDPMPRIVEEFAAAAGDFDAVLQRSRTKVAADIADVEKKLGLMASSATGKAVEEIQAVAADVRPVVDNIPFPPDVGVVPDVEVPPGWLVLRDPILGDCFIIREDKYDPANYVGWEITGKAPTEAEANALMAEVCRDGDGRPEDPEVPEEPPTEPEPPTPPEPPDEPETCPKCGSCGCSCSDPCEPPEPPDGLRYCVWKHVQTGECLVLAEGVEPPNVMYQGEICFDNLADANNWAAQNCQDWPEDPPQPPKPPAGIWFCLWRNNAIRQCQVTTASSPDRCKSPGPGFVRLAFSQNADEIEALKGIYCTWQDKPDQPDRPDDPDRPEPPQPPPEPPTEPPGDQDSGRQFKPSNDLCDTRNYETLQSLRDAVERIGFTVGENTAQASFETVFSGFLEGIVRSILPFAPPGVFGTGISKIVSSIDLFINIALQIGPIPAKCNTEEYKAIYFQQFLAGIMQTWLGPIPKKARAQLDYSENYLCPWLLPTVAEADSAYLTGDLDRDTLESLLQLNGVCTDIHEPILNAKRSKLTPLDVVTLLRREKIGTDEAREKIRSQGYLDQGALEDFLATTEFTPGPSDIIRFMQRDVSDEKVVSKFGLDDEFNAKFTGATARLADWQGVPEEYMKLYWRAHWDIPSPTQLYNFYQRLRDPAEIPVPADARAIGVKPDPTTGPRTDPANRITEDDVKTALAQQDILPYWQDKFLATAYLPLTRVDARRAYEIGVIGVSEIYESLIQNGYSPENASILTQFAKRDKDLKIPNQEPFRLYRDGLSTRFDAERDMVSLGYDPADLAPYFEKVDRARMVSARSLDSFRLYADGEATQAELENDLIDRNYTGDQIAEIVERGNTEIKRRTRNACIQGYRESFLRGDMDTEDAKNRLRDLGLNEMWIQETVNGWDCILSSSDRLPRVRMVAEWLTLGIIDEKEADRQLERMRFSEENRNRILAQIQILAAIRRDKEAEKERAKEAREVEKRRKAEETARRRRQAAADKAVRDAAKRKTDAERLAIALQKLAEKWAPFIEVDIDTASDRLQSEYGRILAEYPLSDKYALQALTRSVEWAIKEDERDLPTVVDIIAPEVVETVDALLG